MFKFQRIVSGGIKWQDNLYIEDEPIGGIGFDEDGLYIKTKRYLTLKELNLLIAQLVKGDPRLLDEKVEITLYK
ncbi:hypothetical protein [Paenibacillus sp. Marseille-Q4541]|uniref:hypothetical protein n=1 Tax=Paenibacillus sp. Marseille-Q4541 TaxID=2831522 RepID=UPI001BA6D1E5|nr:hypothetical protein [Paenibacillus sp. Marseille-Q4541]